MINVAINGFGRIGRLTARIILQKYKNKINLCCVNTSGKIKADGWAHLLKYDTVYGCFSQKIEASDENLIIGDCKIPILGEKEPAKIPWDKYNTQIVIESTGKFLTLKDAKLHLKGLVEKVILAAPPKDENIPMYVIGVNDKDMGKEKIISCASCTTNCAAPVTKVIEKNFGIKKAMLTTIHAYTSDQELLDGSHKDLRRARAAGINIIPTTTGAAKAVSRVYPRVKGVFDGLAIRVPVAIGSLTDFVFLVNKKTTINEVNNAFEKAAQGALKNILGVTKEPIVSSDIIGLEKSALVDLSLTNVVDGDLVKVVAWYDNEWGYANRLVETVLISCQHG